MNFVFCNDIYIVNTIYGFIFYYNIRKNEKNEKMKKIKSPEMAKG